MVLFIIAQKGFRDEEYFQPKKILEDAGYTVVTASAQSGPAQGKLGGAAVADIAIRDAVAIDYMAIAYIGGPGSADYFNDKAALVLAKEAYSEGRVVAAICIAPVILANAGILKGKKATVFPSEKDALTGAGADYSDVPVAVDGNVITASGPHAAQDFGEKILAALREAS